MQIFYVNIGGGEPTVRADFWELVDYATDHHVGVKFSTNGSRITAAVARGWRPATTWTCRSRSTAPPPRSTTPSAAPAPTTPRWPPWGGWPRPASPASSSRWWSPATTSASSTHFKALADRYGAQLRLTRLRPSGRGADVWDELHPTADQQRLLYDWLVAHGEDVLTGDSFFHLAGYGEPLPGLNLCGAGRVVCLVDPVGDVYACPFAIHDEFLAGNVRSPGGFAEVWRHSDLFAELRRPAERGACGSCGHYDACRGGCMAAKFFTGLPLDGPDPECVLGHGERPVADRRPPHTPRPSARPLAASPPVTGDPPPPAGPTGPATRARSPPLGSRPRPAR